MSDFRKRLLRRCVAVVLILGVIGYVFGQAFLLFASFYSPSASDPANQRVLWQTPLTMAGFGLVLTLMMEGVAYVVRKRKQPVPVKAQPSTEELLKQILEQGK